MSTDAPVKTYDSVIACPHYVEGDGDYDCGNCGLPPSAHANYDGAPYCSHCGARHKRDCNCGPIPEND